MSAPVFVVPVESLVSVQPGATVRLEGSEGRHAVTVRRLAAGEPIRLVDGAGRSVAGRVAQVVGKDALDVEIDSVVDEDLPQPYLVVAQALAKGDRGELAVELLTEIGVDEIIPWAAANCVVRWRDDRADRSRRRWVDASVAAAKQARRARFPHLAELSSTARLVDRVREAQLALVLHEGATEALSDVTVPVSGEALLIVGPEGGISDAEVDALTSAGAVAVRMGPTVLRTSSAGMAAAAALLSRTSRWTDTAPLVAWEDDAHE